MKFWRIMLILWIFFLNNEVFATQFHAPKKNIKIAHPAPVHCVYGKQTLVAEINHILQSLDSRASIGIYVKSMKYGDTLYTKNEQRLFVPASSVKIMTAEAALLYLGPEYTFPTRLLTDAKPMKDDRGIINGNLYLVQSGDPSLTYYDLTDMMAALKSLQIHEIHGNIYIDNTAYDDENYGPGWEFQDKRFCFAAPINASIINQNCLPFKIAPAKKTGQLANIIQSPRYFYGDIQNSIVTKNPGTKSCYVQMDNTGEQIIVDGCIQRGHNSFSVSTVIEDVMEYNKSLIENLFQRFAIQVQGQVDSGQASAHLTEIAVHYSKPLHMLVNDMLKKSNNVIAGSLLKKMGQFTTKQPGSWENGSEAVKQILFKKAAVDPNMTIVDGSGLSMENKVKPLQMMQVLDFAYHHYPTSYEFISALPIAGRDGTLKMRLRNVANKVRAKTGTLAESGVIALAGYAISKDKEPMAFVIMVNGRNGNVWQYREIEDKIVTALTNYSRGN